MRYFIVSVALVMLAPFTSAGDFPNTWVEFKSSADEQNRKVVSQVEAEAKKNSFVQCVDWGNGLRSKVTTRLQAARHAYLLKSKDINGLDVGRAREREVVIGMTACGVYAAYGLPDKANTTERANSFKVQLVYRARSAYIYTELNNKGEMLVTAIQR